MTARNGVQATDGRVIGSRAEATRSRLLTATSTLLNKGGVLELKVVDVTRVAGTSSATFYQYFTDVSDAILELAGQADGAQAPLLAHFGTPWKGASGRSHARAFAEAYVDFWEAHAAVLRVRALHADEGDPRFRVSRSESTRPLIDAMSEQLTRGKQHGKLDPYATGVAMIAMLDRLSAYQGSLARRGVQRDRLIESMAAILFQTLTGDPW